MLGTILWSFAPYALVTALTPGPNNILALNTVASMGWRRGKAVLFGIAGGFLCVMVLCALACFELARLLPQVTQVLKYVGAAYIVWLAVHVAMSKPAGADEVKKGSFWMGFVLQFVNIKIILYALTIQTGYVLPVSSALGSMLAAAVFSTVVGVAGTQVWALAGGLLQRWINRYYRPFNLVMAAVLLWSAIKLFLP